MLFEVKLEGAINPEWLMAPLFAGYSGKIETNFIDDGGMILRIRAI